MDENTYVNHVKNFKLKSTKIKKKIKMYTKEQVSLVDARFYGSTHIDLQNRAQGRGRDGEESDSAVIAFVASSLVRSPP